MPFDKPEITDSAEAEQLIRDFMYRFGTCSVRSVDKAIASIGPTAVSEFFNNIAEFANRTDRRRLQRLT